ncbi:30S ribosomal protein S11 [Candidatus Uhrbacteria bacterium CG_4_9_14_3_um_filter_41_35]|uniref:Small ribosomal subunit protein uS11 n=1 Tax=Candidatus Uhrbacteria bacterium CG_4_9_14_3_um_filter_41_35 TaxID=1975034 RepID=A0A2M7XFE3_9BACT|nr:MAG: 30S ribosomal protein S11 [Candidatus Uhrbacteria bacterium CG11_big_fil_rev_8_21_14_0_20_41_9]PJA46579.1 MAG: 30S ribosomal protein S11 [Candidatus Uhrbacteria bacterium CG_4_9_14_3_um_filter_41_35]
MTEEEITIEETTEATEVAADDKKKVEKKQPKFIRTAKGKKRTVKSHPKGRAYVQSTLNNTIVTLTDANGNVLTWASAGNCGFKGPKKATPYAASIIINKVADKAEALGMKDLQVFVTGIGNGRDSAIRTLNAKGFNIVSIKETTPVPHNGCRARRPRRI